MRFQFPVYDPIDGKNEAYDLWPGTVQAPPQDVLLANILLELRLQTRIIQALNPGLIVDEPESMRLDEASAPIPSVPNSVNFS